MTTTAAPGATHDPAAAGRRRRVTSKLLLGIPALAVLAFGGQLLLTGWFDRTPGGGHQVQDLAWGAMEGVLLLVGLVALLRRPERRPAAALQVFAVAAALLTVMLLTAAPDPFTLALVALAVSGSVLAVGRPRLGGVTLHRSTAVLAAVAAVSLVPYALAAAAAQRTADDRHAEVLGYIGAAVWALAVVAVVSVASLDVAGARLPAVSAAAAAAVVGSASVLWPDVPSSLGVAGGATALVWAVALALVTLRRSRPAA